jgi:hypothetical protein
MRNARMGGQGITYYDPAERASEALTRPSVHAPARTAGKRYDAATREKDGSASVGEGIRQNAMQRHSILRTTGAVDVIRGLGPVWAQETSQHDHMTYGPARNQF